jgi:hypothetical protein
VQINAKIIEKFIATISNIVKSFFTFAAQNDTKA